MNFSDWTKKKKEEEEKAKASTKKETNASKGETQGTASPSWQPSSFEEWTIAKKGVGSTRTGQRGVGELIDRLGSYSERVSNDYNNRNGKYQDAKEFGQYRHSLQNEADRMQSSANAYRQYYSNNRKKYGDETVDKILSYLDEGNTYLNDVRTSLDSEYDFWSQFENEDQYNEYNRLSALDIEQTKRDLEALTIELERAKEERDAAYHDFNRAPRHAGATEEYTRLSNDYQAKQKRYDELNKQIAQLNGDIYKAQHYQDSAMYNTYLTAEDAPKFTGTIVPEDDGKYMTEEEIQIYNYLLGKEGDASAKKYLKHLEEAINYRKGKERGENIENIDNWWLRSQVTGAHALWSGVSQFGRGIKQLFTDEALATSPTQYADQYLLENVADDSWAVPLTGKTVGQLAYEGMSTVANMAPSILVSAVAGKYMPGAAASLLGSTVMGASAGGNAYNQAMKDGYTKDQARNYGIAVGASEGALQYLLGGIGKLGGTANLTNKTLAKVAAIDNGLLRAAAAAGVKGAGEVIEEELQNFLEPLYRSVLFGEEYTAPEIEEIVSTAVLTFLTTGVLESGDIANYASNRPATYGKEIKGYGTDALQGLIDSGLESAEDTESRALAESIAAKQAAGKEVKDWEVGRLAQANEAAMYDEAARTPREALEDAAREVVARETGTPLEGRQEAVSAPAVDAVTELKNIAMDRALKAANYGQKGMETFTDVVKNSKEDPSEVMRRFDTPYQAGLTGLPMEKASIVNDFQRLAYNAGRLDHIARLGADVRHKSTTIMSEQASGFDHSNTPKDVDQTRRDFATWFANKMGVMGVFDGYDGVPYNGFYDPGADPKAPNSDAGIVHFAQDFGISPKLMQKLGSMDYQQKVENLADQRGHSFVFYVAHEIAGHVAMDRAPVEMRAFANAMHNYKQGKTEGANLARDKQTAYGIGGVKLDTSAAVEEITSDSILELYDWDEQQFMDAMHRVFESTNEQAKKGARKFLDILKDTIAKLKAWLNKLRGKGDANVVSNVEQGITELEQLREKFENAIAASMRAVQKARETGNTVDKIREGLGAGSTVQNNKDGDLLLAQSKDKSTVVFSYKTFEDGGREKLRHALQRNGHTKEEIEDTLSLIEDAADYLKILAAGYAKSHNYTALHDHLIADITTNLKTGKQVMSALVNNGDYPVNIDLALICKKRVAYMNLMTRLIEDGIFDMVNYGGEAIADVNDILRANNFETACLGCFVESRRLQFQSWAETIVSEWNEEVDKRKKNAGSFGFAEGKPKLTDADMDFLADELKKAGKKNKQGNLNLGKGSVKVKMGRLLDKVPSLQQHLTVADLLTPKGLAALREYDANIFSIVKSRYGAASPKIVQDFNPYASELAMLTFKSVSDITSNAVKGAQGYVAQAWKDAGGKPVKKAGESAADFKKRKAELAARVEDNAMRKYLYDIGGARIQSFSDFMIENVFDYLQIMADLAANKFPLHGYTKEIVELRLFGMTGAKWNGSLIAHTERSMGKEFAGLMPASAAKDGSAILVHTADGDYAIGFDDYARNKATGGKSFIQSIGMKDIVALQLDPRYAPYVGSITIGVSDKQILAMLDSPLFSMVIPYHASGMLPGFAQRVGVDMYNDYTDYQNTSVKQMFDLDGNRVEELRDSKGEKIKVDTSYAFNAEVQKTGDARKAADNYIKWCAERHPVYDGKKKVGYATFSPKFSDSPYGTDFTRHRNYYKLLEDFSTYNSITGASAVQGPVTMTFPSESNRLSATEMEAYKQRLRDTGIFSEKDIAKYEKLANKTFKELIADEIKGRAEYKVAQDARWEKTVGEIKDKLMTDHKRYSLKAVDYVNRAQTRSDAAVRMYETDGVRYSMKELSAEEAPKKVKTAYKLFRVEANRPGEIFPLFVGAEDSVPIGKWIAAEDNESVVALGHWTGKGADKKFVEDKKRRVKSKIGESWLLDPSQFKEWQKGKTYAVGSRVQYNGHVYVTSKKSNFVSNVAPDVKGSGWRLSDTMTTMAYRPGWHSGDAPYLEHIGKKPKGATKVTHYADNHIWAEVEVPDDIDYQPEANAHGMDANGRIREKFADLDYIPTGGNYEYKTNSNMLGKWVISGAIRVTRILSDAETRQMLATQFADRKLTQRERMDDAGNVVGDIDMGKYGFDEGRKYSMKVDTNGLPHDVEQESSDVVAALKRDNMASRYGVHKYASYTGSRIETELRESVAEGIPDYAHSYIAWIDPMDFLHATTDTSAYRDRIRREAGELRLDELKANSEPIYLIVNEKKGEITGHEGRHRMTALMDAGYERVAVIVRVTDRNNLIDVHGDKYNGKLLWPRQGWRVKGQQFTTLRGAGFTLHNLLPLSERYADAARALFSEVPGSMKFSLKDRDYLDAVNRGDMATAQRMVDEAAKAAGYTRKQFHETKQENIIHVFDLGLNTNASADYGTPFGVFTKSHSRSVGLGDKQMRLFVKADRTFWVKDRTEIAEKLPPEYSNLVEEINRIDEEYGPKYESLSDDVIFGFDAWLDENDPDDKMRMAWNVVKSLEEQFGDILPEEILSLEREHLRIGKEWEEKTNRAILRAKKWITKWLRDNHYDSMELEFDNGAGSRVTDALIVLDPDQVKSADPVTYDDSGNIIPLSKRFDSGSDDIRYSLKGEKANLTEDDRVNLRNAKNMKAAGKSDEEIYKETGWYTQSDGKWRTEIPDEIMIPQNFSRTGLQSAKDAAAERDIAEAAQDLKDGLLSKEQYDKLVEAAERDRNKDYNIGKLPVFLNAPRLYEAYPQLKNTTLIFKKLSGVQGYTDAESNLIVLDPAGLRDAGQTVREGLAHEIQHLIQHIEGFVSGSNPKEAGSYEAYRNTGGEIEARDVESRLRMTPEERRSIMPERFSLKGEDEILREIQRIREEGDKAGKSTTEIYDEIETTVKKQYGELLKAYGAIKRGEKPFREIYVPSKSEKNRKVSQTVRTILEAQVTPDTAIPTIQQMVTQGDFSYDVYTDEAAIELAEATIKAKTYGVALAEWIKDIESGKVSKTLTALGWALYNQAATSKDTETAMTILNYMVGHQRLGAQAVQATRILKKLTPDAQLYSAVRSVQKMEEDLNEGKKFNGETAKHAAGIVGKAKNGAADAAATVMRDAKVKRKGKRVVIESNQAGEPFVFEYAQKVGEVVARGLEAKRNQKAKERTFLQQIAAQVKRFAAEKMPKEQKGKSLTAIDLLRDYVQNQAFYADAWAYAQEELREKYAGDPVFDEFINTGIGVDSNINPRNAIFMRALVMAAADSGEGKTVLRKQAALGFTGMAETIADNLIRQTGATGEMAETIRDAAHAYVLNAASESAEALKADGKTETDLANAAIRAAMSDIGIKVSEVVKSGTGESAKQAITSKLVGKYGFGLNQATETADIVAALFDTMCRQYAQGRLESMFKERKISRKTIPEKIEQLARLGAFDVGSAYNQKAAERIFKEGVTLTVNEELARKFMEASSQEERDNILADIYRDIGRQIPARFIDKWNAWRYLAMLGNPRTHVRNIVGNAGFMPVVLAKDATATLIESMVGFVAPNMGRTKSVASPKLLAAAWSDYANVADEIAAGGKYNDTYIKNQHIEEGRRIYKFKPLEYARTKNSELMETEDMWFAKPHYAIALAQYCKANGITADQLRRGKALGNARAYAIKEAQKATYRDTNAFSQTISELGRYHGDNPVKKGVSVVMEGVLPFRKTPANILVRGLEYSPVGLLKGLTYDLAKVKKGDIAAAEAIDNIAAGMTGTVLLGLGVWAAAEGLIRGAGGGDDEEKEFAELQGHQAYALELPDGTSVTLDWLAPEVLPLFIGVNLCEMARENKGETNLSDILTAVSNVTEPLLEMSCLQSLNDIFDSVGYASTNGLDALPSALASAATSYLTQAFPTILGQAERSTQDVRMTTYTEKGGFLTSDMQYTLGKISAKTPRWDFQQIPYIDAWGRTESTGTKWQNAANNFLNPAYTSEIVTSEMEEELKRLHEVNPDSNVFPSRPQKQITVDGEKKYLTGEEYVTYATEQGQLSYDLLTDLTSRPEYEGMTDGFKAEAVELALKYASDVAKTTVSDYELDGWVKNAHDAESQTGMSELDYILYKVALGIVDQPNKNGELGGSPTNREKADAIATMNGLSDGDIAYLWDTKDGHAAYDAGIDMRSYIDKVAEGVSVDVEKMVGAKDVGMSDAEYYDFLDALDAHDKPTDSGTYGTFTQDEAEAAIRSIPGLSNKQRAYLWQSVNKGWKAKNNPWG